MAAPSTKHFLTSKIAKVTMHSAIRDCQLRFGVSFKAQLFSCLRLRFPDARPTYDRRL
jgi:hypothetical protein